MCQNTSSLLQISAKSPDMNVWIAKETERNNKYTVQVFHLAYNQLYVFTCIPYLIKPKVYVRTYCISRLSEYSYLGEFDQSDCFSGFPGEKFNNVFKSVYLPSYSPTFLVLMIIVSNPIAEVCRNQRYRSYDLLEYHCIRKTIITWKQKDYLLMILTLLIKLQTITTCDVNARYWPHVLTLTEGGHYLLFLHWDKQKSIRFLVIGRLQHRCGDALFIKFLLANRTRSYKHDVLTQLKIVTIRVINSHIE